MSIGMLARNPVMTARFSRYYPGKASAVRRCDPSRIGFVFSLETRLGSFFLGVEVVGFVLDHPEQSSGSYTLPSIFLRRVGTAHRAGMVGGAHPTHLIPGK